MLRALKTRKFLSDWTNAIRTSQMRLASTAFEARPAFNDNAEYKMPKRQEMVRQGVYIDNILKEVLKTKKISDYFKMTLNSIEANLPHQKILSLIQCFGQVAAADPPKVRISYVNKLWNKLKDSGMKLDVSHYNILLKVYLENDYNFSPEEFLQQMKEANVKPNRVTYKHLLSVFCRKGDLSGATSILEEMKEESVVYNENIFNELILGHCVAKDIEGAESIIKIMEEKNIDVGPSTYAAYLSGLAISGDIEKFDSLLKKCADNNITFRKEQLVDIIYYLAVNGHKDRTFEMINSYSNLLNNSLVSLFFRLLNKKQYDTCFQILNILNAKENALMRDTENMIYQYTAENEHVATIKELVREWEQKGYGSDLMTEILYYTLKKKELFPKSLDILRELPASGQPVKEIYFWPMVASAVQEQSVKQILYMMKIMRHEFGIISSQNLLVKIIFNNLSVLSSAENLMRGLVAIGFPHYYVQEAFFSSCIDTKRVDKVFELAEHINSFKKIRQIVRIISDNINTRSPAEVVSLMKKVADSLQRKNRMNDEGKEEASGEVTDDTSNIAQDVLDKFVAELAFELHRNQSNYLQKILQEMVSQKLPISNATAEAIKRKFTGSEIEAVADELTQFYPIDVTPFLKKDGNQITEDSNAGQFIKYCRKNMIDEAEKILQEHPSILSSVYNSILLALKRTNNEEKYDEYVSKIAQKIREGDKGFRNKLIMGELLKKGYIKEACILMGDFRGPQNGYQTVMEMLGPVLDNGSLEDVIAILNSASGGSNFVNLRHIFTYYRYKGNFQKMVNILENVEFDNVGELRLIQNLIKPLVNNGETELLNKVINILETKFPPETVAKDLVFAYACVGNIKKGREYLELINAKNDKYINVMVDISPSKGRIEIMENLLNIMMGSSKLNKLHLYELLMENYENLKVDPKKGLALWEQMQDDNVLPSPVFLASLARLLKANNMPVPFDHSTFERQEWIFESNIPRQLSRQLFDKYMANRSNGIENAIRRGIKAGYIKPKTVQQMIDTVEQKNDMKNTKYVLRYCLSLAEYKQAFDEGRLLQHTKEVSNSTDPDVILNNIPQSFLINCLMTEEFDSIPTEVAQIIMWACCHEVLNDKDMSTMYESKARDSAQSRTVVEGVLKFAPYLTHKKKILNFLITNGIFERHNIGKEVTYVLNLTSPSENRQYRRRDRRQQDTAKLSVTGTEKEAANMTTEKPDDGQELHEVLLTEERSHPNTKMADVEDEAKSKEMNKSGGSV